jgi:hypothetical protein
LKRVNKLLQDENGLICERDLTIARLKRDMYKTMEEQKKGNRNAGPKKSLKPKTRPPSVYAGLAGAEGGNAGPAAGANGAGEEK